jgi:hypothetical protein
MSSCYHVIMEEKINFGPKKAHIRGFFLWKSVVII